MKKLFTVLLLFTAAPSFAYIKGDMRLSPSIGGGISTVRKATVYSADDYERYINSTSLSLFKEAERVVAGALTIGCGFDYFFADSVTVGTGLFLDYTPAKITYPKKNNIYDHKYTFDFWFLNIPLGVHYFGDIFVCGVGLYLDWVLTDTVQLKAGDHKIKIKDINFNNDIGLFIDLGVHFNFTDRMDLGITGRLKNGLTKVYNKHDLITDVELRSFFITLSLGFKL